MGLKGHTGLLGKKKVDTDSATRSNQFGYRMLNIFFLNINFNCLFLHCIYYTKQFRSTGALIYNVEEKFIYFSNLTQIVKLVY